MNIDQFIKTYKTKKTDEDKITFLKKHIVKDYIPFEKKLVECNSIVITTSYVHENGKRTDIIRFDSPARYVLWCMRVISLYTDIDNIDTSSYVNSFDKLNKEGLIDAILGCINERDLNEFSKLLNMTMDDLRSNEYSLEAILYNLKKSFNMTDSIIEDAINDVLKE